MDKQKTKNNRLLFNLLLLAATKILLLLPVSSYTNPLNLSQTPLFLSGSSIPNIMLIIDDSGSMDWEIMTAPHWNRCTYIRSGVCTQYQVGKYVTTGEILEPTSHGYKSNYYIYGNNSNLSYSFTNREGLTTNIHSPWLRTENDANQWVERADWRTFSSSLNTIYFNPDVTYEPWPGYPNASFTTAKEKPDGSGSSRNLTNAVYVVAQDDKGFYGTNPGFGYNFSDSPNGMVDLWDTNTIYNIGSAEIRVWKGIAERVTGRYPKPQYRSQNTITDPVQVSIIQQNFANWYQYHRRRFFSMKSAIFSLIKSKPNYRYMLSSINSSNPLVSAPQNSDLNAHNSQLITELKNHPVRVQGTPLRQALDRTGRYFMERGSNAPIQNSCQLNFSLLMTDGHWNGSFSNSAIGDEDGDGNSQTLADIAAYYYKTDLRPDLADSSSSGGTGTATHQRMHTITLGFGLKGSLQDSDNDGWPDNNGVKLTANSPLWGNPLDNSGSEEKINDLWHAAFNSDGLYINSNSTSSLLDGLTKALNVADSRVGSGSSVGITSGSTSSSSTLFQGLFDSNLWSGNVKAFTINDTGNIGATPLWDAHSRLSETNTNSRMIFFSYPTGNGQYTAKAFRHSHLTGDWKAALRTKQFTLPGISDNTSYEQAVVDFLRGNSTYEGNGFRTRDSKLGDIVHSSPIWIPPPKETSPIYAKDDSYATFKQSYSGRKPLVFVGANDGMLHAFNAATGDEKFAYIPSAFKEKLYKLADPTYSHQYYFDATPVVKDAWGDFAPSKGWLSVLTSGFRAGGKGLFALNVTNPDSISENNAGDLLLWEFNSAGSNGNPGSGSNVHANIGYIYGKPAITKLNTGQWAVVTGNGYNSIENSNASGKAALFILDIATGHPVKIIETSVGSRNTPNGLSEPILVDTNNDGMVDIIYAGDLQGNIWKFDVSGPSPSGWGIAHRDENGHSIPLFSAGANQPVTAGLAAGKHPQRRGRMVYFGTGRYLTIDDNTTIGQATQAFYGVWDDDQNNRATSINTNNLLAQTITLQSTFTAAKKSSSGQNISSNVTVTARETSRNSINWGQHKGWYINLEYGNSNNGERVTTQPILNNGRVMFTTMMPSSNSCGSGGTSWLMELNAISGSRLSSASIDINGDGAFDKYDYSTLQNNTLTCALSSCAPASGILYNEILAPPATISKPGKEERYSSDSSGNINKITTNPGVESLGRQDWKQIYLED